MNADNFCSMVEKEMKAMDKFYDFDDFIKCVDAVGNAQVLKPQNFHNYESGLNGGKALKTSRPILAHVKGVEFAKNC